MHCIKCLTHKWPWNYFTVSASNASQSEPQPTYEYSYGNLTNSIKIGEWSCMEKLRMRAWFKGFWMNYLKKLRTHCSTFAMVSLEKYQDHRMSLILSQYCLPWIMASTLWCLTPRFASELERLQLLSSFWGGHCNWGSLKCGSLQQCSIWWQWSWPEKTIKPGCFS